MIMKIVMNVITSNFSDFDPDNAFGLVENQVLEVVTLFDTDLTYLVLSRATGTSPRVSGRTTTRGPPSATASTQASSSWT